MDKSHDMTANEKMDRILLYLKQVHDEPIVMKSGKTEDGGEWSSISMSEFEKQWKTMLEVRHHVFGGKMEIKEVELILSHLAEEKLIHHRPPHNMDHYYRISFKGQILIEDGGHVEIAKRTKIDYDLKEQQLAKMNWDVSKMRSIYYIAIIGLAISIVNFMLGSTVANIIYLWSRH